MHDYVDFFMFAWDDLRPTKHCSQRSLVTLPHFIQAIGIELTRSHIDEMIRVLDADASGSIEYNVRTFARGQD